MPNTSTSNDIPSDDECASSYMKKAVNSPAANGEHITFLQMVAFNLAEAAKIAAVPMDEDDQEWQYIQSMTAYVQLIVGLADRGSGVSNELCVIGPAISGACRCCSCPSHMWASLEIPSLLYAC
jgi:hypothetical protein